MKDHWILGRFDRNLADIGRWSIVRTIRYQSVATHSYYVALMMPRLLRQYGIDDPALLLLATEYALSHDMSEVLTGDVPTPAKKRILSGTFDVLEKEFNLSLPEVPKSVELATKCLDLFEAALFLAEEIGMGNGRVVDVLTVIRRKLAKAAKDFEKIAPVTPEGPDLYSQLSSIIVSCMHGKVDPLEPFDP
jgi:5'-deoxynucleotidase YfbR-like HD superfamily hydrolase